MFEGCKIIKTYWAVKPGQTDRIEVMLEGACGDKCGYVRCVETGDRWMTYGYTTLAPAGEVQMSFQLTRPVSASEQQAPAATGHQRILLNMSMPSNEEHTIRFEHRNRTVEVTFLPDEDGATPADDDNEFKVSAEQARAWDSGAWWYFGVMVNLIDRATGEPFEGQGFSGANSYGRLPSVLNHHELIERLANELCDEADSLKLA